MKKMRHIHLLTLFTTIVSQVYINIDEKEGSLEVSEYLKNSSLAIFNNYTKQPLSDEIVTNDTVRTDMRYAIQLKTELDGIMINDISIKYNNAQLDPGLDYVITPSINKMIFPKNYFNTNKFKNAAANLDQTYAQCNYNNPGPSFDINVYHNITIDSYVSFANYNFGIDRNSPGIQVTTFYNNTFKSQSLDDFVLKAIEGTTTPMIKSNDLLFDKIYVSQPNFAENNFLLAQANSSELYVWEILDNPSAVEDFKINFFAKVKISTFNITQFTQVDIYKGNLILGGEEGFIIANSTNKNWTILYHNTDMKVNDFITNNKTIYLIEKDFGMRVFDLANMNFSSFELKHPGLLKFDWAYDTLSYFYFLGIFVANNPPEVYEILIELVVDVKDDAEYKPDINKVILSTHPYSLENIITDSYYGMTYLYDPESMSIHTFIRAVFNKYPVYHYSIDLRSQIEDKFAHKALFNPMFLMAEFGKFTSVLLIKNNDDYLAFSRFTFPNNTLACNFTKQGEYDISFSSDSCNIHNQGDNCNVNYVFIANVISSSGGNAATTVIIILIIVGLVIIITIVLLRVKKCFKKKQAELPVIEPKYAQNPDAHVVELPTNPPTSERTSGVNI
jgi:hypothetical protein